MPTLIDITGQRFGRLTVLSISREASKETRLLALSLRLRHAIARQMVAPCGTATRSLVRCRQREAASRAQHQTRTHALSTGAARIVPMLAEHDGEVLQQESAPISGTTADAASRSASAGETFENFLADMGERPAGRSLDRINNNRGYLPANCRWATRSEQNKNKRRHTLVTYVGMIPVTLRL